MGPTLSVLDTVDVSSKVHCFLLRALVVTTEILGQLLVIVEHDVGLAIFPDDSVQPQLLHEEHLVG